LEINFLIVFNKVLLPTLNLLPSSLSLDSRLISLDAILH